MKKRIYTVSSLVWATKLLLAAIGLVFPTLVLGDIFFRENSENLHTIEKWLFIWHNKKVEFYLVNNPMA